MMTLLQQFFSMGGYGFYVWSAYACVLTFLFLQWGLTVRRWQRFYKQNEPLNE